MKQTESIPVQATNLILGKAGKGDLFFIKWGFFKLQFQIRPLWCEHIVKVNNELARMKEIDTNADQYAEMFEKSDNYTNICNSIAIAALFSSWKIFFFKRFVSRLIMKAEPEGVQRLWEIVKKQSDAERFFFIMASAKGFNKFMTKKRKVATAGLE